MSMSTFSAFATGTPPRSMYASSFMNLEHAQEKILNGHRIDIARHRERAAIAIGPARKAQQGLIEPFDLLYQLTTASHLLLARRPQPIRQIQVERILLRIFWTAARGRVALFTQERSNC